MIQRPKVIKAEIQCKSRFNPGAGLKKATEEKTHNFFLGDGRGHNLLEFPDVDKEGGTNNTN